MDFGKFKPQREPEKLEAYLIAANDPEGSPQLRPIFRRKRAGEVLTRQQVSAIKKGRKLLRKEMKEQGLKRRIDFEITATNMGLFFDRNRLFWPFFLWLIRDNTVIKVLATTALLTTAVTVSVPVIQYLTEYITEYVQEFIDRIVERIVTEIEEQEVDRFTINLSDELFNSGFVLSEDYSFEETASQLIAIPATGVPCVSIRDIPRSVNDEGGVYPDNSFFAYTFYCRYESSTEDPIDYHWSVNITQETEHTVEDAETGETFTRYLSDAIWVMVFEDNEMMFYAKVGEDGEMETIPEQSVTDMGYIEGPLMDMARYPEDQFEIIQEGEYHNYWRVKPQNFVSDTVVAEGIMMGVTPFNMETFDPEVPFDPENPNGIHKYTVVIWLEGDDPECTNDLIGGSIGMNFVIKFADEVIEEDEGEDEEGGENEEGGEGSEGTESGEEN